VSGNGLSFVYVSEDARRAPDIWTTDATFTEARQLTHLNPQFEKYKMGSARVIDWWSDDGEKLQGALLLPSDYEPGKRYPLLVSVYPGMTASNAYDAFGFGFSYFNMQLFATRGYAVLCPDAKEAVGERFAGLVKSVLPGVSKVVELGIADPARVGVMGHSQGGFAALALLVGTSRFKAAMSVDGWGDSTSYYGVLSEDGTGYQYGQAERQLGASPWQRPTTYIENSPVYYLDRVTTPLLLVHGSEDDAHPAFLGDEIFVGLRRLGKRVEYAKYMNEGHVPSDWSYANQVDYINRVLDWFKIYLGEGANGASSVGPASHN
jgi:dipeptidyl aminopeptidase/acylaminoacyl peptidase